MADFQSLDYVHCKGCGKTPDAIPEYVVACRDYGCTPTEYVQRGEGTYNPKTGQFWCTECYIKVGMPLGRA